MGGATGLPGHRPLSYRGPITGDELTDLLQFIDTRERTVHALLKDESTQERRERIVAEVSNSDNGNLRGLLVGVKDLFHTEQFPTRGGSLLPPEAFLRPGAPGRPSESRNPKNDGANEDDTSKNAKDSQQQVDAPAITRLRDAGAVILGKTVSTEFAYFAPGPTTNPINENHTPGGSSSGSAAAVAAGYCHAALGTQTIGSITRPASFCGVVGYKPSFGRIAIDGVIPFSPSADHVGIIAADVATATNVATILVDRWDPSSADTGHASEAIAEARQAKDALQGISAVPPTLRDLLHLEIGTVLLPDDAYLAQGDRVSIDAINSVAERLIGLGVAVQRISVFDDIEEINTVHRAMIAAEFAEVHEFWFEEFRDSYDPRSIELVEKGRAVSPEILQYGRDRREEIRRRLDDALRRHGASIWIAPSTVREAPAGIDSTGNPIMNLPWTYAGVPTVGIPLYRLPNGIGPSGLPLGLQIGGPFGGDEHLLYLSALIEAAFL